MAETIPFKARFNGRCHTCNGPIVAHETLIRWSRRHRGVVYHAECPGGPGREQDAPQQQPQGENEAPRHEAPRDMSNYVTRPEHKAALETLKSDVDATVQTSRADTIAACQALVSRHLSQSIVLTIAAMGDVKKVDGAHAEMPRLLYTLGKRRHAYLWGPPGSGKSKAASMAAEALGLEYGYCSLNPQTPESRLLGYMDASGTYRRTVFRERFENGGVMCIDEMDNGHAALLNTLNGMLEPGATHGAFPDGMVKRHANFIMVCTGNTNGRGGDKMFPERRQLDAAFAERFVFLHWGYDEALEHRLTLAQCEDSAKAIEWLTWVRGVRRYCTEHAVRLHATPRAAMTGAAYVHDSGWTAREIAEAVLFKGLDRDTVANIIRAVPLPRLNGASASDDD